MDTSGVHTSSVTTLCEPRMWYDTRLTALVTQINTLKLGVSASTCQQVDLPTISYCHSHCDAKDQPSFANVVPISNLLSRLLRFLKTLYIFCPLSARKARLENRSIPLLGRGLYRLNELVNSCRTRFVSVQMIGWQLMEFIFFIEADHLIYKLQ